MATYVKYQDFVEQLCKAKHDFSSHTFKVGLATGAPDPTHAVRGAGGIDTNELTTANGYTAGGATTTIGITETTGTVTVTATDPAAWTASGAGITFRYAFLYNDTATSPADALIAYWDNGSNTTVTAGNTLTVDFGASLFTLA
jgi:hypothetical protein